MKPVWVERDEQARIIRIFRGTHSDDWKKAMEAGRLFTCPKRDAIGEVRHAVYLRSGGQCEWCGRPIPENGPLRIRMNMHEQIPKGNGGEVSLENCRALCFDCHFDKGHGDRKLHFSTDSGQ